MPEANERVQELAQVVVGRVAQTVTRRDFTPGMAEMNVFDVVGRRELGESVANALDGMGAAAVTEAHRSVKERYGARSPHGGWIAFVMFGAVMSAGLSAAFAFAYGLDPSVAVVVAVVLAIVSALCEVIGLLGSRMRPMHRLVIRMQVFACVALAAGVWLSLGHGFVYGAAGAAR